jgi:hypothetical protein
VPPGRGNRPGHPRQTRRPAIPAPRTRPARRPSDLRPDRPPARRHPGSAGLPRARPSLPRRRSGNPHRGLAPRHATPQPAARTAKQRPPVPPRSGAPRPPRSADPVPSRPDPPRPAKRTKVRATRPAIAPNGAIGVALRRKVPAPRGTIASSGRRLHRRTMRATAIEPGSAKRAMSVSLCRTGDRPSRTPAHHRRKPKLGRSGRSSAPENIVAMGRHPPALRAAASGVRRLTRALAARNTPKVWSGGAIARALWNRGAATPNRGLRRAAAMMLRRPDPPAGVRRRPAAVIAAGAVTSSRPTTRSGISGNSAAPTGAAFHFIFRAAAVSLATGSRPGAARLRPDRSPGPSGAAPAGGFPEAARPPAPRPPRRAWHNAPTRPRRPARSGRAQG